VWHRIHRNIFTHREPKSVTEDDVLICSCTPHPVTGAGCGDECINRDVLVECDPGFCPCGEGCQNQKFSRKQYAKLDIARTGRKGHGLFAKQGLRKGQFIIEYIGEVLHEDEYRVRKQRYEDEARRHYYFMTLSSSETIDAAERGNAGRFLNHSCSPNCETQKWMVNGELCIGIYALTDVKQSDELTFDYNFERYGDNPIKCYCATSKCGGWIGAAKASDNEGAAHDDEDGDYDLDPEPVMLEADEEKIKEEELKGREARGKSRVSRRGGGADDARWKPPKKSNVDYNGEEDEDYDQDEMMPAKKRADDSVNGGGSSGGGSAAKSRGTPGGGGGGGRKTTPGSSVRKALPGSGMKRAGSSGVFTPSHYGTPATAKRRSEIDAKMEYLRGNSGALRNAKAAQQCIQLFNLAYPVTSAGAPSIAQRDLGLLLEAVALTVNPKTQMVIIEKGFLHAAQTCISRLGGADAKPEYVPILRKILKIITTIMANSPSLVVQRLIETKSARGNMAQADPEP
jgi:histone-lysine N-methyltransferase SETD2